MGKLIITQKRSVIGSKPNHRRTIRRLGLKRINDQVTHDDNLVIRGMVKTVIHLIEVEEK